MDVDKRLTSQYKGTRYYFCGEDHKELFDSAPDKYIS
jgi:YHS domain-containing protein